MTRSIALWVVAGIDGICAVYALGSGLRLWLAAHDEESLGSLLGGMGLVVFGLLCLALGAWLVSVARKSALAGWMTAALLLGGLAPAAAAAPVWFGLYPRPSTSLLLACTNLDQGDPSREIAVHREDYTYFALLDPAVAREPDTRYRLKDAVGNEREFRLNCAPKGSCALEGATEAELRQAVSQMLPKCPAARK